MNKRVVITGLGVVSSIGIGWQEFWDNLLKGKSGISPVASIDTTNHFTHNGGEVTHFDPRQFIAEDKIQQYNRSSQFAVAAADPREKRCPAVRRPSATGKDRNMYRNDYGIDTGYRTN